MSNVVANESNQNLGSIENKDSSYQSKTLKTQLEWESVYLDLQKKQTFTNDSNNRNSAKFETDTVESNDIRNKYLDKFDNSLSSKQSRNAIVQSSENVVGSVISTGNQHKNVINKLNASSAFGMNATAKPVAANYIPAKTVYTNSNPNIKLHVSSQIPEINATVVSGDRNEIKVWVRSTNMDVLTANKVVDSLKSAFLKLGMRVTEITLNGEKVWIGNTADASKLIPENNKKHINTVY